MPSRKRKATHSVKTTPCKKSADMDVSSGTQELEEAVSGTSNPATPTLSSARLPDPIDPEVAVIAFRSQQDVLLTGIHSNLTALATKLLAKFVITQEMLERASNAIIGSRERGGYLLGCIQDRIKIVPADFAKVVDILQSEPTLTQLASQLVDSYHNTPSGDYSTSLSSPTIPKFANILKTRYRKYATPPRNKWPPTPNKGYIELALVEGHEECREDYIGHVLKGDINEVPRRRKICEKDILDLCAGKCRGRVMVIQGAPGIGKSTLAWELCRKWEEYASMKVYSLVILLRLREERVQRISTVSDLFYAYDREDKKSLTEEIKNNQGKGVLFVLDGFDELPKSLQADGILTDLMEKSVLSESTIIVTTRPSAYSNLLKICPSQLINIEILGFTEDSIKAYITSVFPPDSKEFEGFKRYISASDNPAINSLMYVPLHAAIVVNIYKGTKSKNNLPRTITQLYKEFCLTILNRYLDAKAVDPIHKLENLPEEHVLHEQFLKLAELAYEGFKKEEIIFYSDLDDPFGFLDAVPDLYGGRKVSFNFLHLTLQEFFTAYHISQLTDSGVELFKAHGKNKRWNVVWRFVAGLTQFKYLEGSLPIKSSSFVDKESLNYIPCFFIQCLFEAQTVKIDFQSAFQEKKMSCEYDSYTDLDYYALGYCIANCTTPESFWNISFPSHIEAVSVSVFTQGLMTNTSSTGVIDQLNVNSDCCPNVIEYLHVCVQRYLLHSKDGSSPLSSITDLTIRYAELLSNEESIHFLNLISHMPHLSKLNIDSCQFGSVSGYPGSDIVPVSGDPYSDFVRGGTDGLLKFLQHLAHSKVTSLNIERTGLEYYLERSTLAEFYYTAIQILIGPSSSIKRLSIAPKHDFCRKGSETMIRLVSSPSSLRNLRVDITNDRSLLRNFCPESCLTELKIVKVGGGYDWCILVPSLVKIIQHNTTLEELQLTKFNIAKDIGVLRYIITVVRDNETLRHVTFEYEYPKNERVESTLEAIDPRVRLGTYIV